MPHVEGGDDGPPLEQVRVVAHLQNSVVLKGLAYDYQTLHLPRNLLDVDESLYDS